MTSNEPQGQNTTVGERLATVEALQSAHKEAMDASFADVNKRFEDINKRLDRLEGWIAKGVIAIFTLAGAIIAVLIQNALD